MAGHVGLRFDTDHFYCRYARRQENKCPVVMRIKNNKQTGEVLVEKHGEHHHPVEKTTGFTREEKTIMRPKIVSRFTAGQIQDEMLVCFYFSIKSN
jgi:hypothetical protein